jgi:hypothetical protein
MHDIQARHRAHILITHDGFRTQRAQALIHLL